MSKLEFLPGSVPAIPCAAAVKSDTHVYISGTAVFTDAQGEPIESISTQTRLCLEQVEQTLSRWGLSRKNIAMVTVFIRRKEDFAQMNRAFGEFFGERYPARTACIVELGHPDMLVELSCVACF